MGRLHQDIQPDERRNRALYNNLDQLFHMLGNTRHSHTAYRSSSPLDLVRSALQHLQTPAIQRFIHVQILQSTAYLYYVFVDFSYKEGEHVIRGK